MDQVTEEYLAHEHLDVDDVVGRELGVVGQLLVAEAHAVDRRHVDAVAQMAASPPIEVALVLDNTGSMSADMPALRSAASDLVEDLLEIDGDSVRVALVPFVAQVNIGNSQSHMAWMDTAGQAAYNGELLEDRSIAYRSSSGTSSGSR